MAARHPFGIPRGHTSALPTYGRYRRPGDAHDFIGYEYGAAGRIRPYFEEDFCSSALPARWTATIVKTAGTPTSALLNTAPDGIWRGLLDNTDEVQSVRLFFNDVLPINPNAQTLWEAIVRIPVAIAANQQVRFGLASAYQANPDAIAKSLFFTLEADMHLKYEGDDATTDVAAVDSGIVLAAGDWHHYGIEILDRNAIRFFYDDNELATIALPALSGQVQPYFLVGKASGAGVPAIDVDWCAAEWNRSTI